jgi:hypothetical protein
VLIAARRGRMCLVSGVPATKLELGMVAVVERGKNQRWIVV